MKFRARTTEHFCIHKFTRIVATVAKVAEVCVFRLTPDKIYFIMLDTNRANMWCELSRERFFREYNMEGISEEQNEIYLEVYTANLATALRSAQDAKAVKIHLTKKHGASLTVEVDACLPGSRSRLLVHDVPVVVVARRMWHELQEPNLPPFDVGVILPSPKILRNVADRMTHFGQHVIVSLTKSGTMSIKVETDQVSVETVFNNPDGERLSKDGGETSSVVVHRAEETNRDEDSSSEVRVEVRKLSLFLSGQQINENKVICNIVHRRMIHFVVADDGVTLQYFLPAVDT